MTKLDVFMIVGPSSTGKTQLAKTITDQLPHKAVAVNDKSGTSPFSEKIPWHETDKLKDCALVVEDLIALSKPQLDKLRDLLNFKGHHDNVNPIILITHTIVANGMSQFLPFITRLIFSASPGSLSSVKRALNVYGFSREEIETHLKEYTEHFKPFGFFELGINTRVFSPFPAAMSCSNETKEPDWRLVAWENAKTLFKHLQDASLAETIFAMILPYLSQSNFNHRDLSVHAHALQSDREFKISLVDYIDCLTDESKSPGRDLMSFHVYLKKRVLIPESFIKNKKFVDL